MADTLTLQDVLELLPELRKHYGWDIGEQGLLRGACDGAYYCPITALAHTQHGTPWDLDDWEQAARDLGLPLAEASAIVCAADDDPNCRQLRQQLLQALGLEVGV